MLRCWENPSQTSVWCPMVTAQLVNMTGDTNFVFVVFLFFYFIKLSLEPIKRAVAQNLNSHVVVRLL